jgi:site-specific DNA-methyltransferase (adenine-specific)
MIEPYYDMDNIKLFHGDSRDVLPQLQDESVDLIVTDPPYGMNRVDNDGKDYLEVVAPILREAWRILKQGGSMFVFTSTGEVVEIANALGQRLKRMFWLYKPADMTYPLAGWLLKSEAILWFVKGERAILAERKPFKHDCYILNRVGREGVEGHPTVKPLVIVKDFVSRCPIGGTVLDPFAGSGTTLLAAKRLGRRAIGIEMSEAYCKIAVQRLSQKELFGIENWYGM